MTSNAKEDSNQGEDETKTRSRVSKACTRCRTRKDRCDGTKPACSACVTAGKECIYDAANKKRGLQEGYVRGLEKLLALATQGVTGLEDVLVELMNNEILRQNWNANTTDEFHANHWKDSRTQRELETLLSDASTVASGQKRKRGENDDNDDEESPLDLADVLTSELGTRFCIETKRKAMPDTSNSGLLTSSHGRRLPTNARFLLDHYFAYVHCWLPFLSRPHVLRVFYAMSRSQDMTDCASSMVWAILAYTTMVVPRNTIRSQLRQFDESEIQITHMRNSIEENQNLNSSDLETQLKRNGDSSEYRQMAHNIIYTALSSCKISDQDFFISAQSLLLLAMLDLGNAQITTAWVYVSTAVGIVSVLSSAGECTVDADSVKGFRQAALILRAAISLQLKDSPSVDSPTLLPTVYKVEDGHDEWEPWNASNSSDFEVEPSFSISIFNRSTRVFKVLAEITSRDPMTMTSSNVQAHLESLHHARRNDSVARLADPSGESPPHHVFFMMFHLMVQLHLVSMPTYHETGSLERARLACNTVGLLEVCATNSQFSISHVPPLLSSALRLASQQAKLVQNTFGEENALPSFRDFSQAIAEHQDALASTWPIFGIGRIHETLEIPEGVALHDTDLSVPPTLFGFTNSPLHLRNQSVASVPSTSFPVVSPIVHQQSTLPLPPGISETMLFPNTSPSHQGDSLDAVFNEMAYLDTNEWNFERDSGLRDFGFSDDVAFQAFCNDPERVNIPGGLPQMPLSSNRKSWAFTEHSYDHIQR